MRTLVLLLTAAAAIDCWACMVSSGDVIARDPIQAMERADVVYFATVEALTPVGEWSVRASVVVHEIWKGAPSSHLYNDLSWTCSRSLEKGRTYLVYASRRSDGELQVIDGFLGGSAAGRAVELLRSQSN